MTSAWSQTVTILSEFLLYQAVDIETDIFGSNAHILRTKQPALMQGLSFRIPSRVRVVFSWKTVYLTYSQLKPHSHYYWSHQIINLDVSHDIVTRRHLLIITVTS